jgi:hypothetical protein
VNRQEANMLRQLIGDVRSADGDVASYNTWRHPDKETRQKLAARQIEAHRALDAYVESLVRA